MQKQSDHYWKERQLRWSEGHKWWDRSGWTRTGQKSGEVSGGALGTRTGRRDDWMTDEFPSFSTVFHNISSIGSLAAALEDEILLYFCNSASSKDVKDWNKRELCTPVSTLTAPLSLPLLKDWINESLSLRIVNKMGRFGFSLFKIGAGSISGRPGGYRWPGPGQETDPHGDHLPADQAHAQATQPGLHIWQFRALRSHRRSVQVWPRFTFGALVHMQSGSTF